jgi:ADP-heptose:LPS heptosyltransferase
VTFFPGDVHHILCIKPRGIGDIVLSTIILDNLSAFFHDATIDYLTEGFAADAVRDLPQVHEVIEMGKGTSLLTVVRAVRKRRYDLVIDLWSNPRTAQITFLSGARYRVGFSYRGRRYAYNLPGTAERGRHHSAEHNLELLIPLGVPVVSRRIQYVVRPEEIQRARGWCEEHFGDRPIIGLVPSGGWASKRCEASTWIAVGRALRQRYDPAFLVLWGPGDETDAAAIVSGLGATLAPPTSVRAMAAFLRTCALVIANDSGPMHVAAALLVPTIGIFGPTDPALHGPYGSRSAVVIKRDLHCIICNALVCPYGHECMLQLPVGDLCARVEELDAAGRIFPGDHP